MACLTVIGSDLFKKKFQAIIPLIHLLFSQFKISLPASLREKYLINEINICEQPLPCPKIDMREEKLKTFRNFRTVEILFTVFSNIRCRFLTFGH